MFKQPNKLLFWGPYGVILILGVTYFTAFVWRSSFLLPDGHRHFCLFDDAMVSMRYAWNLLQGKGLVWNPNEYVEGYTNLLQVLIMGGCIFLFGKEGGIIGMHFLGGITVLLVAWLTRCLLREFIKGEGAHFSLSNKHRGWIERGILISTIAYYPLVFWSLMGMETGLNTLLVLWTTWSCLKYRRCQDTNFLFQAGLGAGLAFITRPDSIILSLLIFLVVTSSGYKTLGLYGWGERGRNLLYYLIPFSLLVFGQVLFRRYYYHQWLPNTYTLKMAGFPLLSRIQNGLGFVWPYLVEHALLMGFAIYGALQFRTYFIKGLMGVILLQVMFQIYVGGDAWNYWRMLVPAFPFLLIFGVFGCLRICKLFLKNWLFPVCLGIALFLANFHCLPHQFLFSVPRSVLLNAMDVEVALTLKKALRPNATIAVAMAGAIPYFSELPAIDMLGKADTHIAHLPPDLAGNISWSRMHSVPGHNKYDLNYSIRKLDPDYIQLFSYGNQNLKEFVDETYDCYWIGNWTYFVKKKSTHVSQTVFKTESAKTSANHEVSLCKANIF